MTIFRDDVVLLLPQLRALAHGLTGGNRSFADDLVQDTVVNALRAQRQFTPGTNLRAWLFTILRNRFRSLISRKHVTAEVAVDDLDQRRSTPAPQEVGMEVAAFRRAFACLSAAHREALVLSVAWGLPYDQVARICGCRIGTVKSRVSRARGLLRAMLLDDDGALLLPAVVERAAPARREAAAAAAVRLEHVA